MDAGTRAKLSTAQNEKEAFCVCLALQGMVTVDALADEKKALADKLAVSENSQAWVRRELFQDHQRHKSILQEINEQNPKTPDFRKITRKIIIEGE